MMLLSAFTPTHNPKYLEEAYWSLCNQDNPPPFEWVLVPNNGCTPADIPEKIRQDPRVRIIPAPEFLRTIGGLKRFACEQAKGGILTELDHDDQLFPQALGKVAEAHLKVPGSFCFSDFVHTPGHGKSTKFSQLSGWESYPCDFHGTQYTATRTFQPCARSICEVYTGPDHIRSWSRDAYSRAGGHSPAQQAGDDHCLVCRTYLTGAPFVYIAEPLYLYRRWASNSYKKFQKDIRETQTGSRDSYLRGLVQEDCRRHDLPYYELDAATQYQVPAQLAESAVGAIHLRDLHKLPGFPVEVFNQIYRCLTPGGWLLMDTCLQLDGGQPSAVKESDFRYLSQGRLAKRLKAYRGRFQEVVYKVEARDDRLWCRCDLAALKGQRHPGKVAI